MGKGRGAEGKDEEQAIDPRHQWMMKRIGVAMKLRHQELRKIMEPDSDNSNAAKDFCDTIDVNSLYVVQRGSQVTLQIEPPNEADAKQRRKLFYFMKLLDDGKSFKIDLQTIHKQVIFGDLANRPLESLNHYTGSVFLPSINIAANIIDVTEVAQPSLMETVHNFFSQILVTNGLVDGRTLLPMPNVTFPSKPNPLVRDKDLLYLLESNIVKWTAQIRAAIVMEPETILLKSDYPGPLDELAFWKSKRDNLLALEEQLHTPMVLKIRNLLEKSKSSYYKSFKDLMIELRSLTCEVADNYRFLEPVSEVFITIKEATNSDSFEKLVTEDTFKKLFHYFFVIWNNSEYYNTPARLVVLIREVVNDLICAATENVSVEDLFSCESEEAVKRLSSALGVCGHFKAAYFIYKAKASREGLGGKPPRAWKFQNTVLFNRLDAFLERCHDVLDVLETVILFNRLERVEIGGTHGAEHSAQVTVIHQEFLIAYQLFHTPSEYSTSGLLNIDEPRFDSNFVAFRNNVRSMEKHLGSMLTQSLEETRALSSIFKLVDTYEGFLDRNIIQQEWYKRQTDVLKLYHNDLLEVQQCFRDYNNDIENQPIYHVMPPTAAQLVWARGLLERIQEPFSRLCELTRNVLSSEIAIETMQLHENLTNGIKSYITDAYEKWAANVGSVSMEKLKLSLLRKTEKPNGERQVLVNFDNELEKLLRNINYLQVLNGYDQRDEKLTIPPHALALFKRRDQFRSQRLRLELIVSTYNNFTSSMLPVERPLLTTELQQFEYELMRGVDRLNWNSSDIDDFIDSAMTNVQSLNNVLGSLAQHMHKMQDLLLEYTNDDKFLPLHTKESKTLPLEEFTKKYEDNKQLRRQAISNIGNEIHELMGASLDCVNGLKERLTLLPLDSETECWANYVSYANGVVMKSITKSVVKNLTNLQNQLSTSWLREHDGIPLIDIKLVLTTPDANSPFADSRFVPQLSSSQHTDCLDQVVNSWIRDATESVQYVTRLDALPDSDESYVYDIGISKEVITLNQSINNLIQENAAECSRFEDQFKAFRGLWEDDIEKSFRIFMASSNVRQEIAVQGDDLTNPSAAAEAATRDPETQFFGVPLEGFDLAIGSYERTLATINELPGSIVVGWLRIDSKPIRESLKEYCKRWITTYTGYIVERIGSQLRELNDFIKQADEGLDEEVTEDDESALRRVLKHIRDCKVRDASIKTMFDPISCGIQVLRQHGDAVDDKALQQLEELRKEAPDHWKELDKKYRSVQKENNGRQERQGDKLKYQALSTEEEVISFRTSFKDLRPFHYNGISVEEAYEELVVWNSHLFEREKKAEELNELLELFEKQTTDLPELKECRHELIILKQLWDMVSHVKSQFTDWWGQTFKNMDAEELITRTKDMLKQMKAMPIKCKSTNAYIGLEEEIKSMLVTLPLVENLRNPAMRTRHWHQLLKRCNMNTDCINPEGDEFSLRDLLSLQLHCFEDDVGNIVEKAQKELQIEKGLISIFLLIFL